MVASVGSIEYIDKSWGIENMSTKLLIIIIVVVLLLMGLMGAGFFIMMNKMNENNPQGNDDALKLTSNHADGKLGPILSLSNFIVNTADKGGNRYLRVKIDLEVSGNEGLEEVNRKISMIKDNILMILSSKKISEIIEVEGKIGLRDEIISALNVNLSKGSIVNLYFTEFVIQ